MKENQMFGQMEKAARLWLAGKEPRTLAQCAGVEFRDSCFRWCGFGKEALVTWPDCAVSWDEDGWLPLVALHYLNLADGTPLSGRYITFFQQKNGMVRGGGFDRQAEVWIRKNWGRLSLDAVEKICREVGGRILSGSADLLVEFLPLPRYPIRLNFWVGDEEFPASGRFLIDSSAEHYLSVEDSVALGESLLLKLEHQGGTR